MFTTFFVVLCQLTFLVMMSGNSFAQLSSGITTDPTAITTGVYLNTTMFPVTANTTSDPSSLCKADLNCEDCVHVSGAKCYFCLSNATGMAGCRVYPAENVFPKSSECPLSSARWGVCWVNFEALIIAMSVVAGVLLLSIGTAVYCCCCRSRSKGEVLEMRFEREATERQVRHADRRVEREAKMNTIRQKYGLSRDTASYNRMEDS